MDHRPPQRDGIKPSATTTATGHGSELFADPLQILAGLIEELGWERPGAD